MSASLVGSEMCIRDSFTTSSRSLLSRWRSVSTASSPEGRVKKWSVVSSCLLYTSDAADDM
eukprot:10317724-Alexandrium_andersonii.AAC.1